ncbi:phosphate ABC transporter ATP-binding protein [Mariniblastus sp.]|nr:phosphate ABC transporter ATP-binding protein [Mariniblastus sp.]
MIQTIDLSISYSGKPILENVSISVPQGEILAIVGPSGCGKSSFLAALNRLTDMIPDAKVGGQVLVDCCDVNSATRSAAELRKCVGMIFQKPNPFDMSIRRNIQLALKEHGVREKSELEEITENVLRKVGLWDEVADRLNQSAMKLSGGQQQRLCVARAMALRPQVLLMDEPCSALDPISSGTVEALIQSMRGEFTIIVVTHNLAQAKRIADRVAVFWTEDGVGKLIAEGPAAEVFNNPCNENAAAYLAGLQG